MGITAAVVVAQVAMFTLTPFTSAQEHKQSRSALAALQAQAMPKDRQVPIHNVVQSWPRAAVAVEEL